MKKFVIILLIILFQKTICFSQNTSNQIKKDSTVLITSTQLKYTNLIFAEHKKLLIENELLNNQIYNLKLDNNLLLKNDSVKSLQIKTYQDLSIEYETHINYLNRELIKKKRLTTGLTVGGITITVGLALWLLLN